MMSYNDDNKHFPPGMGLNPFFQEEDDYCEEPWGFPVFPESVPDTEDEPDESAVVNIRNSVVRQVMDDYERDELEYAERMVHEYPSSAGITANCLNLNIAAHDYENAKYYFERLSELPHEKYGIPGYVESIKHLMLDPVFNEEKIRRLIGEFKDKYPDNEECFVFWGTLEYKLGDYDAAYKIVEDAVNRISAAPEAALLLVRLQLKRNMFKEALETSTRSLVSCISSDDANLTPFLTLYSIMARDGIMRTQIANGETVTKEDVLFLRQRYSVLADSFHIFRFFDYRKKIDERVGALDVLILDLE